MKKAPENPFRDKLERLLHSESVKIGSHTPDFILADFLTACLTAFDVAVDARENWYSDRGVGKP